MSLALYIVAENPELQEKVFVNGKALANYYDHVGVIAVDNGLEHIETFIVPEVGEDILNDFGATEDEIKTAKQKMGNIWFNPEEGLKYFEKVTDLVKNNYNTTQKMKDEIIPDLLEFQQALKILVAENSRWRLNMDL